MYVDQYYASYGNNQTQSAADLGADYAALNTAVDNFAAALLANGAANAAGIQAARSAVQDFDFDYYIDLYDFASRVQANVANAAIDNAAAAVMAALGPATIHEHHGATWPGAHGISIYFPKTLGEYDTRYDGSSGFLQFTVDTQWDEWLRAYYAYGTGPATLGKTAPANGATGVALSPTLSWAGRGRGSLVRVLLRHHRQRRLRPHQLAGCRDGDQRRPCRAGPEHHLLLAGVRLDQLPAPSTATATTWWSFTTGAPVLQEMTFRSVGAYDGWVLERDETSGKGGSSNAAATTARLGDDASDRQYRSVLDFNTGGPARQRGDHRGHPEDQEAADRWDQPVRHPGDLTVDMKTGFFHDPRRWRSRTSRRRAAGERGPVHQDGGDGWYRAPLTGADYALVNLDGDYPVPAAVRHRRQRRPGRRLPVLLHRQRRHADRPQLIITYYVP